MAPMLLAIAAVLADQPAPRSAPPVSTRAVAQLHTYFSTDDYPEAAIRRRAQGTVHFSLVVGRDGRPTRCIVDQSAGDPDLDRVTCEIMMSRARFTPARDARGRAVDDRVSSRVRWVLPEDGGVGLPFMPLRFAARIEAATGLAGCRLTLEGRAPSTTNGEEACRAFIGPEGEAAARSLGAGAVLTIVIDIGPAGSPPRPPGAGLGDLHVESAALFDVTADGFAVDCRGTLRRLHRPLGGLVQAPDLCRFALLRGRPYQAATTPTPRQGAIEARIYLRAPAR